MDLETVLKQWCDNNLSPGMCYGGKKDGPITLDAYDNSDRQGKLVYQDGGACWASFAFQDVYLLDDGTYEVYVDYGRVSMMGGDQERKYIPPEKCSSLAEVLDYLLNYSVECNNTEMLFRRITSNYNLSDEVTRPWNRNTRFPILSKCGNVEALIKVIQEILKWQKKIEEDRRR